MTCGSGVGEPLGGELLDAEESPQTVVDPGARDDSAWREDGPDQGTLAVTRRFLGEEGMLHQVALEKNQSMCRDQCASVVNFRLTHSRALPRRVVWICDLPDESIAEAEFTGQACLGFRGHPDHMVALATVEFGLTTRGESGAVDHDQAAGGLVRQAKVCSLLIEDLVEGRTHGRRTGYMSSDPIFEDRVLAPRGAVRSLIHEDQVAGAVAHGHATHGREGNHLLATTTPERRHVGDVVDLVGRNVVSLAVSVDHHDGSVVECPLDDPGSVIISLPGDLHSFQLLQSGATDDANRSTFCAHARFPFFLAEIGQRGHLNRFNRLSQAMNFVFDSKSVSE